MAHIVSKKDRVVRFFLIGLIMAFFMIPVVAHCFFDCKYYFARKTASALLLFFR